MSECILYSAAKRFEAARSVNVLPAGHRARSLHGHGFLAQVRAELPAGWASFPGAEVSELDRLLSDRVARLDYQHLNTLLEQPTDENIARWIRREMNLPGLRKVAVQSTPDAGVDLDGADRAHLWRRYRFEAAHRLPQVPSGHKCGRMHGHGFDVILHADASAAGLDLALDYESLDAIWQPMHERLHLTCLNDVPGLENPTSEMISGWIWSELKPRLPALSWVTVYETANCGAQFDGAQYRIWKEMTLDSAVRLSRAPAGDPRARIHGHTYTLRVHLTAPLDEVLGWTVDFGDVKSQFDPIFRELDHRPLYERVDIADTDVLSLARLIRDQSRVALPALNRVDLYETRGSGVILGWGDAQPTLPV